MQTQIVGRYRFSLVSSWLVAQDELIRSEATGRCVWVPVAQRALRPLESLGEHALRVFLGE